MAISPGAPGAPTRQGDEPDPSMDDILASIRRILNEDDKTTRPPETNVLMLDPSMIVEDGVHGDEPTGEAPEPTMPAQAHDTGLHLGAEENPAVATMNDLAREEEAVPVAPFPGAPSPVMPSPGMASPGMPSAGVPASGEAHKPDVPLVAPAAAAAAAHSVGSLVRTLAAERSAAVTRGGLTIEDLVREEVRPVLKEWLDTHLPPLVERMVRAELERVVGRSV